MNDTMCSQESLALVFGICLQDGCGWASLSKGTVVSLCFSEVESGSDDTGGITRSAAAYRRNFDLGSVIIDGVHWLIRRRRDRALQLQQQHDLKFLLLSQSRPGQEDAATMEAGEEMEGIITASPGWRCCQCSCR